MDRASGCRREGRAAETAARRGCRLTRRHTAPTRDPLHYWSDDTAGKPFADGVQRVVRCLGRALWTRGLGVVPVGWDGGRRLIRGLAPCERDALGIPASASPAPKAGDWLLVPEIPATALAGGSDPVRLGRAYGLRTAAIVHDLIPVKLAHLYDPAVVAYYRNYYRMFAEADLVLATTRHVAADLRDHLQGCELRVPDILVSPLAAEIPSIERQLTKSAPDTDELRLLTVSRWEPRKNLPRLLRSIEALALRPTPPRLHLTVVGRRGGYPAYEADVDALLARLPNVTVMHEATDASLCGLYDTHHAAIYPSYEEGFGLPILESLWHATPCLCHAGSSMAEIAPGGGTMLIDMTDEAAIASALALLASRPDLLSVLAAEAARRPLRSWAEMADDVASALGLAAGRDGAAVQELPGPA